MDLPTIEQFRKEVIEIMISKGVSPPTIDSQKEKELYQNWLKGWKKLNLWKEK